MSLKIADLKSQLHLPGDCELIHGVSRDFPWSQTCGPVHVRGEAEVKYRASFRIRVTRYVQPDNCRLPTAGVYWWLVLLAIYVKCDWRTEETFIKWKVGRQCGRKGNRENFNSLRANCFRGNINIYLHFVSLLHIDMTQVLKILP